MNTIKNSICIVFFLLLASQHIHAQKLEIEKVYENFYVYTSYNMYQGNPFPSNSMYVLTDSGAVL
ncbi:MAG: hypothetical protein HYV28_14080, partial [Ignavibacteriales bacterium]|nr:hypothetical protein [Ignavibacteriales bacterium]